MSREAYEVLALAMRYVFAALMLLIVLRALKITLVDSRRAANLRRLLPQTGIVGELLVTRGHGRVGEDKHFPVPLEGSIGRSVNSDIRLRSSSVRSRHAYFQMTGEGLYVRSHAGSELFDGRGRPVRSVCLRDGQKITVGRVTMLLVLTGADAPPEELGRQIMRRPAYERKVRNTADADEIFRTNPLSGFDDAYDVPDGARTEARPPRGIRRAPDDPRTDGFFPETDDDDLIEGALDDRFYDDGEL